MPGQQSNFAIKGDLNEIASQNILSEIVSMIRVDRQRDFGIDFYCSVRLKSGNFAQTTRDLFGLQIGGPGKTIEYGGLRDRKARQYEIDWLKSLTVPLFYGCVSSDRQRVDMYSMSPIWRILFRSPNAFKIQCEFEEPSDKLFTIQPEQSITTDEKEAFGDKTVWRINLGPPFLSATMADLQKEEFAKEAVRIIREWLNVDWTTVVRFQTRIALTDFIQCWSTNRFDETIKGQAMYWSPTPGANVRELVDALQPALINLGANLQWQDNHAAFSLIPILEWFEDLGVLSGFGKGLLEGLRESQNSGRSPASVIDKKP